MGKPQTITQRFQEATSGQRNAMVRRGAAQYSKQGNRLIRPAVPVEFSLAEYRAWVLAKFGSESGACLCAYGCCRWITADDFVPDHIVPLNRGGKNALTNLAACCSSCNDEKGELDGEWFLYLRRCLEKMPPGQAAIIRERLQKSEKAAASVRRLRGRLASEAKPKPEVSDARP